MEASHDSKWDHVFKPGQHSASDKRQDGEEPGEDEDVGPCAARPKPQGWTGIYILNGREDTHAFQYMHLGYEKFSADGRSFVVEFNINVSEKWRVTVQGRKLWPIFVNLHHHKLEWIKKADRDFDVGRPIITAIVIEPVAEEEGTAGREEARREERTPEKDPALA